MKFEDLILGILHDNSGGLKMTKLVTEVVTHCHESDDVVVELADLLDSNEDTIPFVDLLSLKLAEMEQASTIRMLQYAWPMGSETTRVKSFVYLPLS